ncbi:MAG: SRPBCC family protein [Methyloceanibacter sp.]
MMRLVLGLAVLVGILAAVAIGLPAHVTVSRSVVINAPEYAVFPYINDLRRFSEWSPWAARDPDMRTTYSGPESGKGAGVVWESDQPSIGKGSMEIVDSEPSKSIDLVVNYNGLEGTGYYALSPAGSGSKVTWSFGYDTGSSPLKRWKGLMLNGLVGAEYSAGLDKLKARIEEDRRPMAPPVAPPPQGGISSEFEQPAPGAPSETVDPQNPQQVPGQPAPGVEPPPAAAGNLPPVPLPRPNRR